MQNEITPTAVDRRPSARTLIIRLIFFATCLAAGALLFYAIETRELSSRRQHFEHMVDKLKARFNLSDENVTFILSEVEKSKSICYPGESLLDFLFLASTVVTTIGYGNLTPCSTSGRLFCVFYAFVGIPITALMLQAIGSLCHAEVFRLTQALHKRFSRFKSRWINLECCAIYLIFVFGLVLLGSVVCHVYDGWTLCDGIYFGFMTLTTIGFGDLTPFESDTEYQHGGTPHAEAAHKALKVGMIVIFFTLGLSLFSTFLCALSDLFNDVQKWGQSRLQSYNLKSAEDNANDKYDLQSRIREIPNEGSIS